jgi:hypothetical protein
MLATIRTESLMRSFDSAPVEVRLDGCYCPNKPHEADIVYLRPSLSMAGGMAAQAAIQEGVSDQFLLQELLARVWIRHGVVGWNLVDEDGNNLPLNPDNVIEALPYGKGGRLVAERADDLYAEEILAPLVARFGTISRSGRTNGSTSTLKPSIRKRRSRSSTATTERAPPSA